MLKWLHSFLRPVSFILKYPGEVNFHYNSHTFDPDEIEVYVGHRCIYRYWWIDGERARKGSTLSEIHRLFMSND